jgi:hypothetical protein
VLNIPKEHHQIGTPSNFSRDVRVSQHSLNQQPKHVHFKIFSEHNHDLGRGRKHWNYEDDLKETYFQGVVTKQAIQRVVEQLDKEKARKNSLSSKSRYNASSLSKYTLFNSSSGGSSSGASSPDNVNTNNDNYTTTAAELIRIERLFQIDLRDQRHAFRTGRSTIVPLSSTLERERVQRLLDDDLHRKKLELKRARYLSLRNHSKSSRILKEWDMTRIVEVFKSRIKRLNDRIMALLGRKAGDMES